MDQRRFIGFATAALAVVGGGAVAVVTWHSDKPAATARFYDAPVAAEPPVGEEQPVAETGVVIDQPVRDASPRRAASHTVDFGSGSVAKQAAAKPFSLISATWDDPEDAPSGRVEVRAKSSETGNWSGWQPLETDESAGRETATADVRGGTGAIWVGQSDGVEARVDDGPKPAGLRLNLIDPGAATPGADTSTQSAADFPAYQTRAQWGADESIATWEPEFAPAVKVQFVHHTAGGNDYDCADSPGIIRGILYDHAVLREWGDIGYNFLVDKCGTLFEGAKGGVDRPVIGAHTYGFNTGSSGIAVLGDYTAAGVPDVVKTVIARVAAAKLGQSGLSPIGVSQLTEGVADGKFPQGTVVDFQRVSGHRDGYATECPGNALYAQLPSIREQAGGSDGTLVAQAPTGGRVYSGSYYVKNSVTMNWTTTTPEASLTGFDLLVDGVVKATAPPSARSVAVPLTAGTRKVQVRAMRADGSAITPATVVIADDKAPVFNPALSAELRVGTVTVTAVPATVKWKVVDDVKLASVRLIKPVTTSFGATAVSYSTTAKPGAVTWTMQATDLPGNAASSSGTRTVALVPETSATKYQKWTAKSSTSYLNGKALYSTTKGARLTWTFTGRAVGVIVGRTSTSGKIDIYVDAKKRITLDTKRSSAAQRQMAWVLNGLSSAKHSIAIVNAGTSGVTIDGIAYLK